MFEDLTSDNPHCKKNPSPLWHQSNTRMHWILAISDGCDPFTDHQNIIFIFNPVAFVLYPCQTSLLKVPHWALNHSAYSYTCVHIKGVHNVWADLLGHCGLHQPSFVDCSKLRSCLHRRLQILSDHSQPKLFPNSQNIPLPTFRVWRSSKDCGEMLCIPHGFRTTLPIYSSISVLFPIHDQVDIVERKQLKKSYETLFSGLQSLQMSKPSAASAFIAYQQLEGIIARPFGPVIFYGMSANERSNLTTLKLHQVTPVRNKS